MAKIRCYYTKQLGLSLVHSPGFETDLVIGLWFWVITIRLFKKKYNATLSEW